MNGQTLGFHSKSIAIETKKAMRKSRLQRHFPCRGGEACVSVIPVGFTLAGLVAGGGGGGGSLQKAAYVLASLRVWQ